MNAAEKKFKDMTEAPIEPLLISLAVPMNGFYNMADTYFVGQMGKSATGAVGVAYPVMNMITAIGFGFGNGGGALMANYLGKKDAKNASRSASTAFFLCFGIALGLGILGFLFKGKLVYLLGATDTIAPYAKQYLTFIFLGMAFSSSMNTLANLLRYQGSPSGAMIGNITGGLLNVVLDPILISVCGFGVAGAAMATVFSQFVSWCIVMFLVLRSGIIELHPRNIYLKAELVGRMLKIGTPTFLRQFFTSMSAVVLNFSAKPFGDEAIAAMTIVGKIIYFFQAFTMGCGQGFQPFTGYNQGAGKFARLYKGYKFFITAAILAVIALCTPGYLCSQYLAGLFSKDPDVVAIVSSALRFQFFGVPFTAYIIITDCCCQAMGEIRRVMTLSVIRYGMILPAFYFGFSKLLGLTGVEFAQPASEVAAFIVALFTLRPIIRKIQRTPDGSEWK